MRERFIAYIGTRVSKDTRTAFVKKSKKFDMDQSDALRTLILAFIEDRITIEAPQPKGIFK